MNLTYFRLFKYLIWLLVPSVVVVASLWLSPFVYFYFQDTDPSAKELVDQRIEALEKENSELTKILNSNPKNKNLVTRISVVSPWFSNDIRINSGSNQNLQAGMIVTTLDDRVIGTISKVNTNDSQIRLITDPGNSLAVNIGQDNTTGVLNGLYGYSAEISWIRAKSDLDGKTVYTNSLSNNAVQGLYIGKTKNPGLDKANSFYKVEVSQIANIWDTGGYVKIWIP